MARTKAYAQWAKATAARPPPPVDRLSPEADGLVETEDEGEEVGSSGSDTDSEVTGEGAGGGRGRRRGSRGPPRAPAPGADDV